VAEYKVNKRAVAHARALIDAGRYVLDSDWGEAQSTARDENRYLKSHTWAEYAAWQWRHKEVELAAHRLLQRLDKVSS
jgi:hypothetical protein